MGTAPTPAELQAAWCRVQGRPNWPATYEEAMKDPTWSRLLHLNALHPPRAARPAPARAPTPPPASRARHELPRRTPQPQTAPLFDRKRAAAGERDDA